MPRTSLIKASVVLLALMMQPIAMAADFLAPLPVQEINVGETYSIGIRPSAAPARPTPDAKLVLFAEGLSASASFRRIGHDLWEYSWQPSIKDRGVHTISILVADRSAPTSVLELREFVFVVNDPDQEPIVYEPVVTPIAPVPVSADLDDAVIVEASANISSDIVPVVAAEEAVTEPAVWELAPLASHVVTPHQWVRFPVELLTDSEQTADRIVVQVDNLPNGASFDPNASGIRQFQWRPGTADQGEHTFRFTAVDSEDTEQRESVTMRIIVQE